MMAVIVAVLVAIWSLDILFTGAPPPVTLKMIWFPAAAFVLVLVWITVRVVPWTPLAWHTQQADQQKRYPAQHRYGEPVVQGMTGIDHHHQTPAEFQDARDFGLGVADLDYMMQHNVTEDIVELIVVQRNLPGAAADDTARRKPANLHARLDAAAGFLGQVQPPPVAAATYDLL
jgi:hypothetical protein